MPSMPSCCCGLGVGALRIVPTYGDVVIDVGDDVDGLALNLQLDNGSIPVPVDP